MTPRSRLGSLQEAYRRDGFKGVAFTVASYVAWKANGSPVNVDPAQSEVNERVDRLENAVGVLLMRDWYARAEPVSAPKVAVVLPTKDRPELLRRAVESVQGQSYPNWELLLVDDSGRPASPPWLTGLSDRRIRRLSSGGKGVGAARNMGLEHAHSEIIVFLDDDNVMDPHWVKSTVLAFEADPEAHVLVGAQLVTPEPGQPGPPDVRYPRTFDWETLTKYNFIDMGMLAHRPEAGVRFDESLPSFVDWDYVVRLTGIHPPILVPAISGIYFTDAPGRISYQERRDLQKQLQSRFASLKPGSSSDSQAQLSEDDLSALEVLLRAKARRQIPIGLEVIEVGGKILSAALGNERTPPHVTWKTLDGGQATQVPEESVDLIVLDHDGYGAEVHRALKPGGVVVGLGAHRYDYPTGYPALRYQRRVGDALWIGSVDHADFESLLPGSALIKLGYDSPPGSA